VLKAEDVLLDAVFEDLEVVFGEAGHELGSFEHRGVEDYFLDVGVQNVPG
jgi:hypothetical protein